MIKLVKSTFYKEKETKNKLRDFINRAGQLSFGPECVKFEKNFSKWQGRKYSIFVNSGSSANLALIQALLNLGWLKRGDKVAFSAITWSTNVMPLIQLGLEPVPVDIEINSLNVSSESFLKVIKKHKVKALFVTNLLGFCGDLVNIKEICRKENILLLEDNCESLGSVYKGRKLGNFGLASTFSFYVGHHMSTIEGGAICTDNEELATMLSITRAHGWDRNLSLKRQKRLLNHYKINSEFYARYTFFDLGFNLRPTEINGFLGNIQLNYIDEIVKKRADNFLKLSKNIWSKDGKYIPIKYEDMHFVSNFAFPIITKTKALQEKLIELCKDKVEIRPIVGGNVSKQPFFKKVIKSNYALPNAEYVHEHGFYFGNNPELTFAEIQQLIKTFE